mgnify:CR=1 FL=1
MTQLASHKSHAQDAGLERARRCAPRTNASCWSESLSASTVSHAQDALAGLRRWSLERDDESDPGGRIYRDSAGTIYHSVTRILGATAPEEQQKALERWLERPGSEADRRSAAHRGTLTHSHAEFLLKTARKLAASTANKRGGWVTGSDGLERCSSKITAWGLKKAVEGTPSAAWSAAGYARGLRSDLERMERDWSVMTPPKRGSEATE